MSVKKAGLITSSVLLGILFSKVVIYNMITSTLFLDDLYLIIIFGLLILFNNVIFHWLYNALKLRYKKEFLLKYQKNNIIVYTIAIAILIPIMILFLILGDPFKIIVGAASTQLFLNHFFAILVLIKDYNIDNEKQIDKNTNN